jgi:hypothetical protein
VLAREDEVAAQVRAQDGARQRQAFVRTRAVLEVQLGFVDLLMGGKKWKQRGKKGSGAM